MPAHHAPAVDLPPATGETLPGAKLPGWGGPPICLHDDEAIALGDGAVVIRDGFATDVVAALVGERARLAEHLTPAAMGRRRVHLPSVRGDHTAWLAELPASPPLDALRAVLLALGEELSTSLRLSLGPPEVQLARYPAGARYARHVDTFRGDPHRRLTAVLYLNPDWGEADGGALRVVDGDHHRDIAPLDARLVLFRADAVFHEVLPATRTRWAATAWYGPLHPPPASRPVWPTS